MSTHDDRPRDLVEALAFVLTLLRRERRSAYCLKGYQQQVGSFLRFLEASGTPPDLGALTPSQVGAALDWLRATRAPLRAKVKHGGAAGDATFVRYLKQFARALCEQGCYDEDPLRRLKPLRAPKPHRKPYTESEQRRLIEATSTSTNPVRDRALVLLLLDLGCRIGELCAADVGDVDLEQSCITFRVTKNGHLRQVPFVLDSPCGAALRAWLAARPRADSAPLFVNALGKRLGPTRAEAIIARLGKAARVDGAIPHRFRHTNATEYISQQPGAEIQLRARLGHLDPKILADYVHITQSMSRESARVASISSRLLGSDSQSPIAAATADTSAQLRAELAAAQARIAQLEGQVEDLRNASAAPPASMPLDRNTVAQWVQEDIQSRQSRGWNLRKSAQSLAEAAAITRIHEATWRRWVDERRIYGGRDWVTTHEIRNLGRLVDETRRRAGREVPRLDVGEPMLVSEAAALCGVPDAHLSDVGGWIESGRLPADQHADGDWWLARSDLGKLADLAFHRFMTPESWAIARRVRWLDRGMTPDWVRALRGPDTVELVELLLPARPRIHLRPALTSVEREVKRLIDG